MTKDQGRTSKDQANVTDDVLTGFGLYYVEKNLHFGRRYIWYSDTVKDFWTFQALKTIELNFSDT